MKGRPGKGRKTKGRKTKGRTKTATTTRGRSSKTKKTSKARKSNAIAKRKTPRKQSARASKARGSRKASRKTTSRSPGRRQRQNVFGEGNYTASREFRREQTGFVRRNRNRIPEMGEEAAHALEGSEGNTLRQAENEARSHSLGDED